MEHKILNILNMLRNKGVTISGIQRFFKKKKLPAPLTKPLWEKLCVKCNKMAKLTTNPKS